MNYEELAKQLKSRNIRPSYQRIRILAYLLASGDHPTADSIYQALKREIPALSKSTVYNTLMTFTGAGLSRQVSIDENVSRFDGQTDDHGHFQCRICGRIINFSVQPDMLAQCGPPDAAITERHIYFRGYCQTCLADHKKMETEGT